MGHILPPRADTATQLVQTRPPRNSDLDWNGLRVTRPFSMKRNRFVSCRSTRSMRRCHPRPRPPRPVRGSRATASRRSSTPPSRSSPTSATTGSPWTPSPPRAKASKATLYRRWNDKASSSSTRCSHQAAPPTAAATPARLRGDLHRGLLRHRAASTDKPEVAAFGSVLTAITRDEEFAAAFRRDFIGPKLAASKRPLRAGQGARRDPRRRRPRPARAGPRRDRAAPRLPARRAPPPRTSSPASSTRSSFRPRPRPADRTSTPTRREITHD